MESAPGMDGQYVEAALLRHERGQVDGAGSDLLLTWVGIPARRFCVGWDAEIKVLATSLCLLDLQNFL